MTARIRNTGEFCWINVMTPQPDKARAFFGELLGWTFVEGPPGMGHAIEVGGRIMGAIHDVVAPNRPTMPPVIGVMVKVESADAAVEKARALGGKAEPAFDIEDRLRMACLTDPDGGRIDVWEPKRRQGCEHDPSVHGAVSWFEAAATDADRGVRFYTQLFGWKAEFMPSHNYTVLKRGDEMVGGLMQIGAHTGDLQPGWSTFFTVNDADATAKQAAALGAKIVVPPMDIPDVGRFSVIASPQGVTFRVIRYLPRK